MFLKIRKFLSQSPLFLFALFVSWSSAVVAAPISEAVAKTVATNLIKHHDALHQGWNGKSAAEITIERIDLMTDNGMGVLYNVKIAGGGYVLVPNDDDLHPILAYSSNGAFELTNAEKVGAFESWILPEVSTRKRQISQRRLELTPMRSLDEIETMKLESRTGMAWAYFGAPADNFVPMTVLAAEAKLRGEASATFAMRTPLLKTEWAQGESKAPFTYNRFTPADPGTFFRLSNDCERTLTGCVATAIGQLMKYWQWPNIGTGTESYVWKPPSGATPRQLSMTFDTPYNWASMPDKLSASSSTTEIEAVAKLLSDVGIASKMVFGCGNARGSSAYFEDAVPALAKYFKYSLGISTSRGLTTSAAFFAKIQLELDASIPRPILMGIYDTNDKGGHVVVIDGYETSATTDLVHINFGWGGGSVNAMYNISDDWSPNNSNYYKWNATTQTIITGIEPNRNSNCGIVLQPQSVTMPAASGSGNIAVNAPAPCTWRVISNNSDWLTVSPSSSAGTSSVRYTVTANPSPSVRFGSISIGSYTFQIVQAGASCTYAVNPAVRQVSPSGENATIALTTSSACTWSASSSAPSWLRVTSQSSGVGSADIRLVAEKNAQFATRSANLQIANQAVLITQPGMCEYRLSQRDLTVNSALFRGAVGIETETTCPWNATSNAPSWLSVTAGTSGAGFGTFFYAVAENTGAVSRIGTISVGQQQFTVTQLAANTSSSTLLNPGFESGVSNWTQTGSSIIVFDQSRARTGGWLAWLAGYDGANDQLSQVFRIASDSLQAFIGFKYRVVTDEDATSTVYDRMLVEVYDANTNELLSTLDTITNLDASTSWNGMGYDVSRFRGRVVRLKFTAITDSSASTSFYVDDVSLTYPDYGGADHSCAVVTGGLKCWGSNNTAQLGNNTFADSAVPVQTLPANTGVAAVSEGGEHTCSIQNGGVRCWGYRSNGRVGNGIARDFAKVPTQVISEGSGATSISAGAYHSCSVVNGGLRCWGSNYEGMLGNGGGADQATPTQVISSNSGVSAVAAGSYHTCSVVQGGVQCWGLNGSGQLGLGTTTSVSQPRQVLAANSAATAVAVGVYHSCAVVNGGLRCWGSNDDGQLGNGTFNRSLTPIQTISAGSGVTEVATSGRHTCAVINGGVSCWGSNQFGQLGNGSTVRSLAPVQIIPPNGGATSISAGDSHTCTNGSFGTRCWGSNEFGQLGNNSSVSSSVPVTVLLGGISPTTPSAPLSVSAVAGINAVSVAFTAPASNGGSVILSYRAACGAATATGSGSPIPVTGLPSGVRVSCTVQATNAIGMSPASLPSNVVTPTAPVTVVQPVNRYRIYVPAGRGHLYTISQNEYNFLTTNFPLSYVAEGIAHKVYDQPVTRNGQTTVPFYRLFIKPLKQHFWTTDQNEYNFLRADTATFGDDGIDSYIFLRAGVSGTIPLYRLALAGTALHVWTTDENEFNFLRNNGWIAEGAEGNPLGVTGYVLPK